MSEEEIKEVPDNKEEISKQKKEVPEKKVRDQKISLLNFKIKNNISDIEYAGLRAIMEIKHPLKDDEVFTEKSLRKSLDKFNKMEAFIKED